MATTNRIRGAKANGSMRTITSARKGPVDTADRVPVPKSYSRNPSSWWQDFLLKSPPIATRRVHSGEPSVRLADLYCSVGGLTLGAHVATEILGGSCTVTAAADTDKDALRIYSHNFGPAQVVNESVRDLVDFQITQDASDKYRFRYSCASDGIAGHLGRPSLLIGGPPCQGHSSLNNRTRSSDPKNQLLLTMPALAVALGVPALVIENVPNILNDSRNVVQIATELLESSGYYVAQGVIAAGDLGWPQTRKRFFIVARRTPFAAELDEVLSAIRMHERPLSWAIGDLLDQPLDDEDVMNSVPKLSDENERRIQWLFENDAYELPDRERPRCHQDGHTYPAVYGRLRWDLPAPTITGGFLSPGRGRFVHPLRKRVITPHEAARIQGFPDSFEFAAEGGPEPTRANLAKWIGDAVPPVLGCCAVLAAIL